MFSAKEREVMSLPYFNVIRAENEEYEIQSKNTGHYWLISPDKNFFKLMHKYRKEDEYHVQTYMVTVVDLVLDIVDHDDFKLHGNRLKRRYRTREDNVFEEIVQKYSFL